MMIFNTLVLSCYYTTHLALQERIPFCRISILYSLNNREHCHFASNSVGGTIYDYHEEMQEKNTPMREYKQYSLVQVLILAQFLDVSFRLT